MRRLLMVTVIACLASVTVDASIRYVSPSGSNYWGSGTAGHPWRTIAYGISHISSGDTLRLANGTYNESVSVTKAMTILGEDRNNTVINASAATGYGLSTNGISNVTLSTFTFLGPANGSYGVKLQGVSTTVSATNIRLDHLTVRASKKTNIDLNGINGIVINDIITQNTQAGTGLAITDCRHVSITNLVTSNNAWGGCAIYTAGTYFPGGVDNVSFSGVNSFTETAPDMYTGTGGGYGITNLNLAGSSLVYRVSKKAAATYSFYYTSQERALAYAQAADTGSVVRTIAGTTFYVDGWMKIQRAIDSASTGATIVVFPGLYAENITLTRGVTVTGAGSGSDTVSNTVITRSTNASVITIAANNVTLGHMRIEPSGNVGLDVSTGPRSGLTINDVSVVGNGIADGNENEMGFRVSPDVTLTGLTVTQSAFDSLSYGVYFGKGTLNGGSDVSGVTISGTSFNGNTVKGLYIEKLSHARLTDVTVAGNGLDTVFWNAKFNAGIDINLKGMAYDSIALINPIVTGNGRGVQYGAGMMIKARDDGSYASSPATLTNVTVEGGSFAGNELAIRVGEPGASNAGPAGVVIRNAVITGNTGTWSTNAGLRRGIENVSQSVVDARLCTWGTETGPYHATNPGGLGDAVSDNVLFYPWGGGQLPVQLASFAGRITNDGVLLEWLTLSETNNFGFVVERKREGEATFLQVSPAVIPGAGTTTESHSYSFIDVSAQGGAASYRLKQIDLDGSVSYGPVIVVDVPTGVGDGDVPVTFGLDQNYPNPFNPMTTIRFAVPTQSHVSLIVYDITGREVVRLVEGMMEAGMHTARWDAGGQASGMYLYRIVAGTDMATRTMMLVK